MPYYVPRGSQGVVETYKTEKCRTCSQHSFTCPIRGFLFENRKLKVKVLICPVWTERAKNRKERVEI